MKRSELFLEEAVLDDLAQGLDALEVPLSQKAFNLVKAAGFLLVIIAAFRILMIGAWQNDFYSQRSAINSGQKIVLRAERGIILDRFNKPLVQNLPAFRLNIKLVEFLKDKNEQQQAVSAIEQILNISPDYINDLVKEVDLERQSSLTIAKQLSIEQVIKIKNLNLKSLQVEDDFKRQYPDNEIFAHAVGYTGAVTKNDLDREPELAINDTIGQVGLEASYDKELRGKDGVSITYRNAKGESIETQLLSQPERGYQLFSTIDSEFQSYFYKRLKEALKNLGRRSGVGIALDPRNGEVLALISLPSFDNNQITKEDIVNPYKPLFNRVVSGVYTPGSTIKPLVALAALEEGITDTSKKIFSSGSMEIPNPYFPDKPSRFLDWKPNGWVNLYSALARSSNIYFYAIGGGLPQAGIVETKGFGKVEGLGMTKLKKYWQKFGLGQKTGIDLLNENEGFLPDPEEKKKRTGDDWRLGDTYNVSIGQGDLLITPIQLLNYIAAIANGGKLYQPFIMKKIASEQGTARETQPFLIKNLSYFNDEYAAVQKGMIDVANKSYGTAYLLHDLPMTVAAKTGTSQIQGNAKINAFFVGYAPAGGEARQERPAENPQIAILILIEEAREGSLNTVPVARDVLGWYYENRIKNK